MDGSMTTVHQPTSLPHSTVDRPVVAGKRSKTVTRVCVLGSEAAGKTCFLAGLAVLSEPDRNSGFQAMGRDDDSQRYLKELGDAIRAQSWPPFTTQTRLIDLDVNYRRTLLNLLVMDYPGEDFRQAYN